MTKREPENLYDQIADKEIVGCRANVGWGVTTYICTLKEEPATVQHLEKEMIPMLWPKSKADEAIRVSKEIRERHKVPYYSLVSLIHDPHTLIEVMYRHEDYTKWFATNFPNGASSKDEILSRLQSEQIILFKKTPTVIQNRKENVHARTRHFIQT